MALRFVSGLSNFAELPANVQKRLARADEIDRIPFERRTRQQEAFLASVEGELESLRSNPTARPVEAVKAKLPQVERQVFQKNDGSFENLFSTPLYPVRERLAPGNTSRVALPEMILPAALEDGSLQVNTLPAVFGVQRGYSTAPAARASDEARNAPAIPRRLLSEEDRISDAAFNEAIAELRSQGVDIPAAKLSSSGVQDTLVDIYQSLINRTQSPGYVPGQMRDVQSSSDVPAYLIQAGRDSSDDRFGSGFVYRPEEKGSGTKRNSLLDSTAADIANVSDMVGLDIVASPGLITTSNVIQRFPRDRKQEALAQIAQGSRLYPTGGAVSAGAREGSGPYQSPGGDSIRDFGIEQVGDNYLQSAGRGIFSGSGALQNALARAESMRRAGFGPLFSVLGPGNQFLAAKTLQLSGPQAQSARNAEASARAIANQNRIASNDQIARQIIGQDRAAARLAEEEGTIIDSPSQPIAPRERLNAVANLAAQYIDQIATSGAKKTRVGLPSGSIGISYPRTLGPVLDNPAILRTQTIRDIPPGLSASQAKQVQDADLEFDTDVNLDLGQSVSVPGVVQIASGTHSSLTPYSITTGNTPPGQQTRYSRISAVPIDPVNPELDELQGRLTKRFYKQGIDFQDVDNRLQQGQKALLGQLQAVTDSVAAPTVSRTMDPFTASQGALAYIDEQLSRLAPYANTPSVPGTTYRSTAGSREVRGYEQTNPYEAIVRELSDKRNRINTLLQNYQYLDDQRQRFAKSTAGLFDLAESAEDAKNITLDGDELVPLQEYMDYLVETPTVSRFGIPQQTGSPRLTGDKTSRGRQLFSYGAPDNVSILPDPSLFDGDSKVLDAIRTIDPTAVPNQVRAGIQYREVPRPNSSAYDIIVDNPGVPVLDPATGRPMMADPRAMVGIESQIGQFAEPRLPDNIDSNRSVLQERKSAELDGYSSVPLSQNVPINHLKSVRSPINRQIAGRDYQVVDSSQDGRPIIRQYTSTAPAQTQEPELPLGVTEPRPEYDPRQVALSSAPQPVSLFTGQSQRQLLLPPQLSDIDSLSAQDPAQRGQLFDLAKELQITGTALGDPRNDFLGLKNEIKAKLTSRYPERYATNATFYRNRLPSDATEPAEARQLVDNRIDSTLQSLSFRPIDPSDSNDRYSMQLIAGRMRQDPRTAERVFGQLDSEFTRIQSQIQQQSDVLQAIARQVDSNPQQLVSIDQPSSPLTPTPKKLLLPAQDAYQAKLSQLKELERRQNILQSNMTSIRKLYGY